MKAYLSVVLGDQLVELELHGPLAKELDPIAAHLTAGPRRTLEAIARIDRERARGKHELAFPELFELVAAAYALLADPPTAVRRFRRIPEGAPHPHAERVAPVVAWLRDTCKACTCVHYDLWTSSATRTPN